MRGAAGCCGPMLAIEEECFDQPGAFRVLIKRSAERYNSIGVVVG